MSRSESADAAWLRQSPAASRERRTDLRNDFCGMNGSPVFLKTDSGKNLPYGDEPTDLSRVFPDYVLQAGRNMRFGI
jgi:hypothetical protein